MADRETRAFAFAAAIGIVLTDPEHIRRAVILCADERVREWAALPFGHIETAPRSSNRTAASLPGRAQTRRSGYTRMNYRGDLTGARLREDCPACHDEEMFYSSWVHGDPGGDQIFESYVYDPATFRFIGAQVEEKHVNHNHGHRFNSS